MSSECLRIKIPKRDPYQQQDESSPQQEAMSSRKRTSKKRHLSPESEDDEELLDDGANSGSGDDYFEPGTKSSRIKRGRIEVEEDEVDVDMEAELEKPLDIEDTRFLPDGGASLSRSSSAKRSSSGKPKQRSSGSAQKKGSKRRAVILSDEEEEVDVDVVMDDDEDDFQPEPLPKKGMAAKGKSRGNLSTKASKGKGGKDRIEKEITFRDERKVAPPIASSSRDVPPSRSKRVHSKLDDEDDADFDVVNEKEATPPPPPPKKPKLPTIKKNKPAPGSVNSTGPSTPATRPTLNKTTTGLPQQNGANGLPLLRKPAATANNADFDLRDASVYAQLFTKPAGSTPNSGLNRKEKEEERRKELNRMRDAARAKRQEQASQAFDLQSAANKITRFEDKLKARKSMAMFPNILGSSFKDAFERRQRASKDRERR